MERAEVKNGNPSSLKLIDVANRWDFVDIGPIDADFPAIIRISSGKAGIFR